MKINLVYFFLQEMVKKKTARSEQDKGAEHKCLKRVLCFRSAFYFAREVAQ